MSMLRLALLTVGLFALAFVGVSWAEKGFPIMTIRVAPLKADARIPTFEESVKKGLRKDWENSQTFQSDGNQERDRLRLELLQASTAYKLSPCDDTMKKNMAMALTNYVSAWLKIARCKSAVDVCPSSRSARFDAATAAFGTPADAHALAAMREAIEQGGITPEDFPRSIRDDVSIWIGTPVGEAQAACIIARQSENRR
jgi:hypothetical protein